MYLSTRQFLKSIALAAASLTTGGVAGIMPSGAAASQAAAVPFATLRHKLLNIVNAIDDVGVGELFGEGEHLAAVDEVMRARKAFIESPLNAQLAKMTPGEIERCMFNHLSQSAPRLAADARQFAAAHEFVLAKLEEAAGQVAMDDSDFFSMVMQRARKGFEHSCVLEAERVAYRAKEAARSGKANHPRAEERADPYAPEPEVTLESIFSSEKVRIIPTPQGLRVFSFDAELLQKLETLAKQHYSIHAKRIEDLALLLPNPPHYVLSLARPYIPEYISPESSVSVAR